MPLTVMPKGEQKIAVQTFKSLAFSIYEYLFVKDILSYCLERESSKKPLLHAQKLVRIGEESSGSMRDELYL